SRLLISFIFLLTCTAQAQQSADHPTGSSTAPLPSAPGSLIDTSTNDTSLPLTLTEALSLAEKNSPRLHAAMARSARAAAGIQTAKAYTNPQVEYFGGYQSSRDVAVPGLPGLLQHYAAYQTLEIPSERKARQQVASLARTSSDFSLASERLSVVARVKHAF